MLFFIAQATGQQRPPEKFQYISCYSLSIECQRCEKIISVSIHLMLFFICANNEDQALRPRFNTSHVILYPCLCYIHICCKQVSIHLMLFFIKDGMRSGMVVFSFNTSHVILYRDTQYLQNRRQGFQYISCYSLSYCEQPIQFGENRFNTSHVILYLGTLAFSKFDSEVSIHLMLFFIRKRILWESNWRGFNTSHVILYPSIFQSFPCQFSL